MQSFVHGRPWKLCLANQFSTIQTIGKKHKLYSHFRRLIVGALFLKGINVHNNGNDNDNNNNNEHIGRRRAQEKVNITK